ncbi:MAG TPA: alpha/beta fold hydrolase [Burkholderiaceae bacterium]|jgi:acetyl esterase/lipase
MMAASLRHITGIIVRAAMRFRLLLQLRLLPLLPLLPLLSLAFAGTPALAQPAPLPAEAFFQRPALIDSKLSPSGTHLAVTVKTAQDRISIAIIDLSHDNKTYAAGVSDADVVQFEWVGDDRLVFSARDLLALGSDRRERAPGLFSVQFDGERFRRLVRTSGEPFVVNGNDRDVGQPPLSWNHALLAIPKPQPGVNPDEIIVGRWEIKANEIDNVVPVWLNARNGLSQDVDVGKPPAYAKQWWFDSAGHARALYTQHEGQGAFYWRGPQDADWRLLAQAPVLKLPFLINGVDDAGHLFLICTRGPGDLAVLTQFDFERMAPAQKAVVEVPGFDFNGHLLTENPGAMALGVRTEANSESTAWFDKNMREFQAKVDAMVPGHVNRISCRRCGQPDMVATVRSFSDTDPGSLWLYSAAAKKWTRVLTAMKDIKPSEMATVNFERIKARDGRDLPVWVTLPPGVKPGQPAPTVVMVHGGPWVRGGHWRWDAMNQFLASRGYLVIEPEFRGSTGYGHEHFVAGFKQWGQAMEDDLADALHWAQEQGISTKGRACIMGASYGGYAALMGPVRQPDDWRCVVAWSAVADLDLLLERRWWLRDDISEEGRKYGYPETVGDLQKDAAMLKSISPVLLAKQMKAPVLLAYGDEDLRTPISHGKRMREALTDAGNPPVWVVYDDEGHGFQNPKNSTNFAQQVEAFLARNLK